MKKLLILSLTLLSFAGISQEIVLSRDVKSDTVRPTKGPNLKNYFHPYYSYSIPFFVNQDEKFTIPGFSSVIDFGFRYKRKLNPVFAVGLDLSFNWASYKIKQEACKPVPDNTLNDREKIQVNSLTPEAYIRINAGRRGNSIGNYLDLGGFFSWNWRTMHKTWNNGENDEKVKRIVSHLSYMEPFSYGLIARVGKGRWSITAKYRMKDLFKDSFDKPDLPKMSVGIEVGFIK